MSSCIFRLFMVDINNIEEQHMSCIFSCSWEIYRKTNRNYHCCILPLIGVARRVLPWLKIKATFPKPLPHCVNAVILKFISYK